MLTARYKPVQVASDWDWDISPNWHWDSSLTTLARRNAVTLHCGFTTCGAYLGVLLPARELVASTGERVWIVRAPTTLSQRRPGEWAESRFAQRSATHQPHRADRRKAVRRTADRWHSRWLNARGELVVEHGKLRHVLPLDPEMVRSAYQRPHDGWVGRGRPPSDRHIATLVPGSISQPLDTLSARGHPLLVRLSIACPAHGHVNAVRYDDVEQEAARHQM
jgi:hypothetical protein